MAKMEFDHPKKIKKPRKSYFLGCFGFSIIEKELLFGHGDAEIVLPDPLRSVTNKSTSGKKKKLSFSKIIKKHSSSAKTIPVDISGKSSGEIHVVKTPVIAGDVAPAPAVKGQSQTDVVVHEKKVINKTKDHKTKHNIIHKNNKSLDKLLDNVHHDISTCRNEFPRSVTISSTHNLSHLIINPTKDKHEMKLSHSTSLPPPERKRSVAASATGKVEKSSQRREHVSSHDNFDSIVGMSILMVTLLIMLFWGKACAIVCTCAWFYFLPRFRPENEAIVAGENGAVAGDVDVNSDEYKKKVVLEGFLERNHKNCVGFL